MSDYQTNLRSYLNSLKLFIKLTKLGVLTEVQMTEIEQNLRSKYSIKHNSIYSLESLAM